jgi:hypothetical protein
MNYNDKILRWTNFKIDLRIWNIICGLGSYVPVWVLFANKISIKFHEINQFSDSIALRLCTSHQCIRCASFLKSDYALSAYVSKLGNKTIGRIGNQSMKGSLLLLRLYWKGIAINRFWAQNQGFAVIRKFWNLFHTLLFLGPVFC